MYIKNNLGHEKFKELEIRLAISSLISVKLLKNRTGSVNRLISLINKTPMNEVNKICIYAFRFNNAVGKFDK